jgi:hypothetical protein
MIAMARPHRCLQEGQYRVEVYANGELVDERATEIEKDPGRPTLGSFADMIAPGFQSVFPGDDLRLMSVATANGLVNEGRNLVVVALVATDLHIRIFDASGKKVVDKAENELVSGGTLTALKKRLNLVPDESGLSKEDKQKIIQDARSITGHTLSPLTRVWVSRIFPELNLAGCLPHDPWLEPPKSSSPETEGPEPPPPGDGFLAQISERDSRTRRKQGLETQWIVQPKTESSLDQWITNRATGDRLLLRMRFSGDDEAALGAAAREVEMDLSALLRTSPANWSSNTRGCEMPADIGEVRWSRFTYAHGRGISKVWKGSDGIVYVAVSLVNTSKAVPTAESTQCAMLNSVQNLDRGQPGF